MNKKEKLAELAQLLEKFVQGAKQTVTLTVELDGMYSSMYNFLKNTATVPNIDEFIFKEGLASLMKELWLVIANAVYDKNDTQFDG